MLRVPAMVLASAGHDLHLAHDGEQSLAVANEYRPNEVLLDIGLPKLGGHELSRRLRQQDRGKALILITSTGSDQAEDRRQTVDSGPQVSLCQTRRSRRADEVARRGVQQCHRTIKAAYD